MSEILSSFSDLLSTLHTLGVIGWLKETSPWIAGAAMLIMGIVVGYKALTTVWKVSRWTGSKIRAGAMAVWRLVRPAPLPADGNFQALLAHLQDDNAIWDEAKNALDIGGDIRLTVCASAARTVDVVQRIGVGEEWKYDMLPDLSPQERKEFAIAVLNRLVEVKERDRQERRSGVVRKTAPTVVTTASVESVGAALRECSGKATWKSKHHKIA